MKFEFGDLVGWKAGEFYKGIVIYVDKPSGLYYIFWEGHIRPMLHSNRNLILLRKFKSFENDVQL